MYQEEREKKVREKETKKNAKFMYQEEREKKVREKETIPPKSKRPENSKLLVKYPMFRGGGRN
jgi:hypothetical protein